MLRELGLERCKTVWFLSSFFLKKFYFLILVREDRKVITYGNLKAKL